jgi:hypothetical protein
MPQMQSISQAEVRQLIRQGRREVALELAFVMLTRRFERLPDRGDQLFGELFTPDECEAIEDVLDVVQHGLLTRD